MTQDAQIIIEKESGVVPKDTEYAFPFQIIAPNYGDTIITKEVIVEENDIDVGKVFNFDILRDKFSYVESVNITQLDKYLLYDGQSIWMITDESLLVVPITDLTQQNFEQYGFDENVFIGNITKSITMSQVQQTTNGYIYEVKIPDYFVDITEIN